MKGIKRHPSLRPLSRDHLIALMAAQKLIKAGRREIDCADGLTYFLECWNQEISVHLKDEEAILPEFIKSEDLYRRLLSDHVRLRDFAQQFAGASEYSEHVLATARAAGEFLDQHVRWEEHELFRHIEAASSANEIARLTSLTDQVEASRNRKSGRKYK